MSTASFGMSGFGQSRSRTARWSVRDIRLAEVAMRQDWGSLLAIWVAIGSLAVAWRTQVITLTDRAFLVYDSTLAFKYNVHSTISVEAVGIVGLASLLLSVIIGEFFVAGHADVTSAVACAVRFVLDGLSCFALNGAVTHASKLMVGRLRPDFLERCRPDIPDHVEIKYGISPADPSPECRSHLKQSKILDGHESFPSGHASSVFVISIYCVAYCVWCWHWRAGPAKAQSGFAARTAASGLGMLWLVALLLWAWGVGISRVIDNKHNPSDVIAGAFLGSLLGVVFALRASAQPHRADPADSEEVPLLPAEAS